MPLSDGLDTRPCKILDPRLVVHLDSTQSTAENEEDFEL